MAAAEERQIGDDKDGPPSVPPAVQNQTKPPAGGGKTVRFLNNSEHCDKYSEQKHQQGHHVAAQVDNAVHNSNPTINMVQNLVPHLPGLDKDKVYVISGPFPNFDPMNGPSQLLMATPVNSGATIIAVPTGPPPAAGSGKFHPQSQSQQTPSQGGANTQQHQVYRSPNPHMLHWDNQHPGGQILPLRQPTSPVYYNVPPSGSGSSSGLQSPASEGGSCMSESSSTSGDQDSDGQCSGQSQLQMSAGYEKQMMFQHVNAPNNYIYPMPATHAQMPPHMMGFHPRHIQGSPQYCHMGPGPAMGHVLMHPHHPHHPHHGAPVAPMAHQVFIAQ